MADPYESESDRQRVADGYAGNRALMAALEDILRHKQGLVGAPIDMLDPEFWQPNPMAKWR